MDYLLVVVKSVEMFQKMRNRDQLLFSFLFRKKGTGVHRSRLKEGKIKCKVQS